MGFPEFLLLFCFVLLVAGMISSRNNRKQRKQAFALLTNLPYTVEGFVTDKVFSHPKTFSYIAMDHTNKQLILANRMDKASFKQAKAKDKNASFIVHKLMPYKDIIKNEMVVDDETIITKPASSALAGGLLFGTAGAVIGSNTGKTKVRKDIKSIKLKLLVNDVFNPAHEIVFYRKPEDAALPKKAYESCQNWHDTLTVALQQ